MNYTKTEVISMKSHPDFTEKWLQNQIEADPTILGLGELDFWQSEKIQISGGRLDTILVDREDNRRYEVEIQLGKTDETHIIRTIEYWDLERRRNPNVDHCAVIVAEDITSRFLNVISLFNGFIPLIAIQVKAIRVGEHISLFFTKVLDEMKFELHETEPPSEVDRSYWEEKASKENLKLTDAVLSKLGEVTSEYKLKYNKHYIGIEKNGLANNFIQFIPRKTTLILEIKLDKSDAVDQYIEESSLMVNAYDRQWRLYRIRIRKETLDDDLVYIKELVVRAKKQYTGD